MAAAISRRRGGFDAFEEPEARCAACFGGAEGVRFVLAEEVLRFACAIWCTPNHIRKKDQMIVMIPTIQQ